MRTKIFIFLVILLLSFSVYTFIEKRNISEEFSEYKEKKREEIRTYEENLDDLRERNRNISSRLDLLMKDYRELNSSYAQLREDYEELRDEYRLLESDVDETLKKIDEYEKNIEESMEWFSDNSKVDRIWRLENECMQESGDKCYIKTGCFHLINSEYLDIEYKEDLETTGKEDKLKSLEEFKKEGGDCEDYSLFYKAEWNYLKDKCEDKEIVMDTWKMNDKGDRYWADFDHDWYLDNVENLETEGYRYPSVVCGDMFDPNTGRINGHCIVAFTKEEILSTSDISYLDKAVLIEPQDGHYMGRLNGTSGVYLDASREQYVYQVITDNDHFLYTDGWQSYSGFLEELRQQEQKLDK